MFRVAAVFLLCMAAALRDGESNSQQFGAFDSTTSVSSVGIVRGCHRERLSFDARPVHRDAFRGLKLYMNEYHPGAGGELLAQGNWSFGINVTQFRLPNDPVSLSRSTTLCPDPYRYRRKFFARYGPMFEREGVHGFMCSSSNSLCELFLPFNRPMLVVVASCLAGGRENPERWLHWRENLLAIARNPNNVVAANCRWAVEYVHYFTGIRPMYLPVKANYSRYDGFNYKPSRPAILFFVNDNPVTLTYVRKANSAALEAGSKTYFEYIRLRYPRWYHWNDLVLHPAIVFVPYTPFLMSYKEIYAHGIPMFFPSKEFLLELMVKDEVLHVYINWAGIRSPDPPTGVPDPNDLNSEATRKYWIDTYEQYDEEAMPHVVFFESWADLVHKLDTTNLTDVHARMMEHNRVMADVIDAKWEAVLTQMFGDGPNKIPTTPLPRNFNKGLKLAGVPPLPTTEPSCVPLSKCRAFTDWKHNVVHLFVDIPERNSSLVNVTLGPEDCRSRRKFTNTLRNSFKQSNRQLDPSFPRILHTEHKICDHVVNSPLQFTLRARDIPVFRVTRGEDIEEAAYAFYAHHGVEKPSTEAIAELVQRSHHAFAGGTLLVERNHPFWQIQ